MHPVRKLILKNIEPDKRAEIYDTIMTRKRKSLCFIIPFMTVMIISYIPASAYIKSEMPDIGLFMEGYAVGGLIVGLMVISILYWSLGHNLRPPTDKEREELEMNT